MDGVLAWLQASAIGAAMRDGIWLYPMVETVHIVGFVLLVGSVAMFDLRVLGWGRALPVRTLGRHLLPWSAGSLLLVAPSGLLLFSTQPADFIGNRAFQLKLLLIGTAGINALLFHAGPWRKAAQWDGEQGAPPLARLHALVSLLLWVAVICCGRLIAYL